MQHLGPIKLLDGNGEPFPDHIQHVLDKLSPRLRREFPVLQDDVALIEVLEEAGRRIAAKEARGGPIDRLHGYAWVTLRSVATTHIRRGQIRLIQNAVSPTSRGSTVGGDAFGVGRGRSDRTGRPVSRSARGAIAG